jgi:hypothetical protein
MARIHLAGVLLSFLVSAFAVDRKLFEDRSAGSGIDSILRHSPTPEKHQIETMNGGVALFDYDNDGRPDLYFANGARQPALTKPDPSWHNRLYRNLGGWKFEDVTAKAGLAGSGFAFGVAAGDYDNDGRTDLFVAGMPESALYRNRGDGTFEDVTRSAGVLNKQQWPVAAGWFDYNADGFPDLFVVNYVRWDPKSEPFCGDSVHGKYRTYCHPKHYDPLPNTLFRNNGDGTFTDVSVETGIAAHKGKGMGVAFADYDGDGDLDIFIANDTVPNFLFRNDRGKFVEVGMQAGVATNDDGRALSSMGADFRDVDNDGLEDLFVTALANETFPLYRNLGKGSFIDATYPSRIGASTLPYSGWSNAILDLDNDGWKDLFSANGDVQDNTELFSSRTSRQQSIVLMNTGRGKSFQPVLTGPSSLHRGAAFGDLDGDGALDVVLTRLGETPVLLRNTNPPRNWIAFRVKTIGTKIRIRTAAGDQWNHFTSAVGYASSSHVPVHFGLGDTNAVEFAEIRWPSGVTRRLENPKVNSVVAVSEPAPTGRPGSPVGDAAAPR